MSLNIYKKRDLESYRKEKEIVLKEYLYEGYVDKQIFIELFLLNFFMPPNEPKDINISLDYLDKALTIDSENVDLLIARLYLTDQLTFISESLYKKIANVMPQNYEQRSMIEYAKSWYFHDEKDEYEKCLKKSIAYSQTHVLNYIELGSFYKKYANFAKGIKLQKKGLNNIQVIITELMEPEYYLKIDNFFNEKIKGIFQTKKSYENLIKLVEM